MQTNQKIALIFAALGLILGGAGTIALQTHAQGAGKSSDPVTASPAVQANTKTNAANSASVVPADNNEKIGVNENDTETNDSATDQAVLATAKITADQAKTAAVAAAGAPAGTVSNAELDNENEQAVYVVSFQNNGVETETKVDAISGKVLKTENEQVENQGTKTGNAEDGKNDQTSQETDQADQ